MRRVYRGMTCPKCRRRAYVVCSNRRCVCRRDVPKGKRTLRWTKDGERERCGYCGFTAHADFWFEREWKALRLRSSPPAIVAAEGR